ncbi:hypothetical protein [Agrobacterium tumefaciens]|uniref:hypothetical protein n=1 Tax=Agrobacterium tumefaciens TaxID=358 RepID=UPI00287DCAF7|nr:hypothetical protein [Agrobacterium tumefaciens]MDS7597022.1 hypothetical protein [Agrobacterium tumefaciens]
MQQIQPPRFAVDQTARIAECRETFVAAARSLIVNAVANGWREEEAALALADAADEYVLYLASKPVSNRKPANQNEVTP